MGIQIWSLNKSKAIASNVLILNSGNLVFYLSLSHYVDILEFVREA